MCWPVDHENARHTQLGKTNLTVNGGPPCVAPAQIWDRVRDLVIPKVLPDEHVLSWCGRIHRINDVRRSVYARDSFGSFLPFRIDGLEELALLAGMAVEGLLRRHSTVPFVRAFVADTTALGNDGRRRVSSDSTPKLAARWSSFRYCPSCSERDVVKRGFAYWRRTHQLPGIFWCPWHGVPLIAVEERTTFAQEPGKHLPGEIASLGMPSELAKVAPAVKVYMRLAISTLRRPRPIGSTATSIRLNALIFNFYPTSRAGRSAGQMLKTTVERAFPKEWLERTAPQRIGAQRGEAPAEWSTLLYVWPKPRATERYLITASAIHSDSKAIESILFAPEHQIWHQGDTHDGQRKTSFSMVLSEAKRLAESISKHGFYHPKIACTEKALRCFMEGSSLKEACLINETKEQDLQQLLRDRLRLT